MKHFNLPLNFAQFSDGTSVIYQLYVYGVKIVEKSNEKYTNDQLRDFLYKQTKHTKCTYSFKAAQKRVENFSEKFGDFPIMITNVGKKTVYVLNTL
jgi:hypothetical protein